jgi:acyl carrier protein
MSESLARIKKVTAELLKISENKITENSRFVQDLGAESVQSIELVAAFEEEFNVEMNEDEALAVKTVGDAAKFMDQILARKK